MDEELGLTATAARPVAGGWNLANADRFKLLEAQGVDPQSAWKMTGTWRGKDGRLRQRIAGASALPGYGQASPISEMIGGFMGAPRRFSVMDPEAAGMQTARDVGEQTSVAGQIFGAMTPFAISAAAARAGQMSGVSPLTVFHGSPHKFSKFESSKIGTGEGAQVYGRGLYFAENPAVAKSYQVNLSQGKDPRDWIENIAISLGKNKTTQDVINELKKYPEVAELANDRDIVNLTKQMADGYEWSRFGGETWSDNAISAMKKLDAKLPLASKGSFYTVDLPDEKIAKMLDWDKPFSQQTPEVRKSLQDAGIVGADDWLISGMRGKEIYKRASFGAPVKLPLNQKDDQIYASERLRQAGIPGIRYLDEGSRGAGKGTSNFVVFPGEEEALTILRQE